MPLKMDFFDAYIGIDWSGAKSPVKTKSVALSWCFSGKDKPNYLSEKLSRQDIADWIIDFFKQGRRALIGIDCNFGYANSVCHSQFGKEFKVNDLWSEVEKYNHGNDNFYAGGFWESSKYKNYFWTSGDKPEWFDEFQLKRQTEKNCRALKLGNPECPFKLIGPKQVGKGGLSGMRLVNYLKSQLGDYISIWPFDNDYKSAQIILTEIYPRLFLNHYGLNNIKIRSFDDLNFILKTFKSEQIYDACEINDHQCDAIISSAGMRFFIEHLSTSLLDSFYIEDKYSEISKVEGWIFGVNKNFIREAV